MMLRWPWTKITRDVPSVPPGETGADCMLVNPKGIAASCDLVLQFPLSEAQQEALGALAPGQRVYLRAIWIEAFHREALGLIKVPFHLVTGDGTKEIGPQGLGDLFEEIIENPLVIDWSAQNLGADHPKTQCLPVGLDLHTRSEKAGHYWGDWASPKTQEAELLALRAAAPRLSERKVKGFSNWHFAMKNGDRKEVRRVLPRASAAYQFGRLPRSKSWKKNAAYFFTLSPRGVGMDCHRTYEALVLGATPIIPDLPINRVFDGLPVVVVSDWAGVTPAFLGRERERILDERFNFAPLFLGWWERQLRGRIPQPELNLRYENFMAMGVREMQDFARELRGVS